MSKDKELLAFNEWCKSEEAQQLAAKKWQTDSFDSVYIGVSNVNDDLPEQSYTESVIQAVQFERNVSVKTLFIDVHNKSEGFEYNAKNVEMFLICQKEILCRAYNNFVPSNAYISCY